MLRIYCEHSGLSAGLRKFANENTIELIYFPYDENSRTNKISKSARPSVVTWENIHLKWEEMEHPFNDYVESEKFEEIKAIIGGSNKNDILHVDSAYKSQCLCMVTRDNDILSKSEELERITQIKFFHPDQDIENIKTLLKSHE